MKKEEYLACQSSIVAIASAMLHLPLRDFVAAVNKAQTLGPILDPTLYRKGSEPLQRIKELAEALWDAQEKIRKVNEAVGERAPQEPRIEDVQRELAAAEDRVIANDPEVQAGLQEMADTVVDQVKVKTKDHEQTRG